MVINTKVLQETCKNILNAVDNNITSIESEVIEIDVSNNVLNLNVTNNEYYFSTHINLDSTVSDLNAVVNAKLFLGLVAKVTTQDIDLSVDNNTLIMKANGTYKIPFIYSGDDVVKLNKITIDNEVNSFKIKNDILQSIVNYNSKELLKFTAESPANKLYYLDDKGCITYNSGACINSFNLDAPVQLVLKDKVVKLFKLFTDEEVNYRMGINNVNGVSQIRVEFSDSKSTISCIIANINSMLQWFPVDLLRAVASENLPYSMSIDKNELLGSLTRLGMFSGDTKKSVRVIIDIDSENVNIYDNNRVNSETIKLKTPINNLQGTYTCSIFTNDLIVTMKNISEDYLTVLFGNNKSLVVVRDNIRNVITESNL